MELDDFKQYLKQKIDDSRGVKTTADIALLLTKRTNSVITKLKKSLLFEIIFCIVVLIVFGYFAIFSQYLSIRIYFSIFSFVFIAFGVLLFYLYKKTTVLGDTAMPVKENLQCIYNILKEFTKRYFQFTMLLIPVCLIFSGYLGYQDAQQGITIDVLENITDKFSSDKQVIIFLIVYLIVLVLAAYFFTKWYLQKLYGKYLKELENCIKELE